MAFLFFGFLLVTLMRFQIAYPGQAIPLIGGLFSETTMPDGIMLPEFYNSLGAMHGTIMVFLGIVPLAVGAFGNYVVPLQIGAPDMAFPKLNAASYWCFFAGGVVMMASFFVPEALQLRLDGLPATLRYCDHGPDHLVDIHGVTHYLIPFGFREFHRNNRSNARTGYDLVPHAFFRLGPARHGLPSAYGLSAT